MVLPSIRDPRLHLAAVIVSIHVLGQVVLGFRVSVVQILAAILASAAIEVWLTLAKTGTFVWPASAMLTGSGVALILRVADTRSGDHWTWRGWYLFALVAALSLLTKYVIRYRGTHVFNPSNIGLVAAFLVLGSARVEPLDFWWGPLSGWMVLAHAIILIGGLLITARLRLLAMSLAFWATLAAGIGVLAASGHCMTARWAFAPVCGSRFWLVILLSPELLVFLFFMITDPKTVPAGRVGRLLFAVGVGVLATLLIAPQSTEFGAKVALLGALVVMCVVRLPGERLVPAAGAAGDGLRAFVGRLTTHGDAGASPARLLARGAAIGSGVVLLGGAIVAAGAPARVVAEARAPAVPEVAVTVDPSSLPRVRVDPQVARFSADLAGSGAQDLAVTLAEDLEIEAKAFRDGDPSLLSAADGGDRLLEMQRHLRAALSSGETTVDRYVFDSLRLVPLVSVRDQRSLRMGFEARGSVQEVTYDGEGVAVGRATSPFALMFVLSQPAGERWLVVDVRPLA